MQANLVSVIIPIYNVSEYVDQSIKSVCEQTYTNLEIILIDDGSTDGSGEKCEVWASKDRRIQVIHKSNGGLSDARNCGLDKATGRYVYFLDGDDYIKPNLIEKCVRYLDSGIDLVAFNYEKIYEDGLMTQMHHPETEFYILSNEQERYNFIVEKLLTEKIGWEAWSRIYVKSIIDTYNIRFEDNAKIFAEDLYFCICYCAHSNRILSINSSLHYYNIRQNSIMGKNRTINNLDKMNELGKSVYNYFSKDAKLSKMKSLFPVIHLLIMNHEVNRLIQTGLTDLKGTYPLIRKSIDDLIFFDKQVFELPQCRYILEKTFPPIQMKEFLNQCKYYINGDYITLRIKNRSAYLFNTLNYHFQNSRQHTLSGLRCSNRNRIYFLGSEEYGNIGDHQINESIVSFLNKILPTYTVIEITAKEWERNRHELVSVIRKDDLIVMTGGGNFGNLYPVSQNIRNQIIAFWPSNPKVIFPQSIYFTTDQNGIDEFENSKRIYTAKNRVLLAVRDELSFVKAKSNYTCDVLFVPDIVLNTKLPKSLDRTKKIILCLRKDLERSSARIIRNDLRQKFTSGGFELINTDLQLDFDVPKKYRCAVIRSKLDLWSSSSLVITDRLHGMIFAAITGTPCVALDNNYGKVREGYKVIKYLPYIRYANNSWELEKYAQELIQIRETKYSIEPINKYFNILETKIKNML